jgi:predicted nucleic-acid-binding protein
MIGVDTNVLIRYIVQDDQEQSKIASRFIERRISSSNPGYINHIVLCEVVWVLRKAYHYEKTIIMKVLERVLQTKEFIVENSEVAWIALKEYEKGGADFSDYLIAVSNRFAECGFTVTLDKTAASFKYCRSL